MTLHLTGVHSNQLSYAGLQNEDNQLLLQQPATFRHGKEQLLLNLLRGGNSLVKSPNKGNGPVASGRCSRLTPMI